jgi:hypothetical protein
MKKAKPQQVWPFPTSNCGKELHPSSIAVIMTFAIGNNPARSIPLQHEG